MKKDNNNEKPERKPNTKDLARRGLQLPEELIEGEQDLIRMLRADVIKAVEELIDRKEDGLPEMRYLVKMYYQLQKFRMHSGNVIAKYEERGKPHILVSWGFHRDLQMEKSIVSILDYYAKRESTGMGQWAMSQVGIGPVIATGLLANIDKRRRKPSQLWSFAGLNPEMPRAWGKLGKRPFNAQLKLLCFKIGHSFMMSHNRKGAYYGQIYRKRKDYEIERNTTGGNAALAAKILSEKNFGDDTTAKAALLAGRLPDAQIEMRAERFATKFFLCHWLCEAHQKWFNEPMPEPWITSDFARERGMEGHTFVPPPEMGK